ncbi:MAG: cobalamin-binding protein [Dehalogenimonas sp.]|uniref:Cobalamin-binding protein n=1 Tax=Candidatus Dehalogenimonas loeffleri TaxID=3127115 RepID=A0ABZ2J7U8_9CHLR|nr:cobalamin-binding protein [Dehalogenimonas sp.]
MKGPKYLISIITVLIAVIGVSALTGCKAGEPEEVYADTTYPLTITDQLGRSVTIKSEPQKIISLAPSNTEIVYALGLQSRLVGVTTYCNYPEAAKDKPKVGGFSTVNVELITSAKPDLIIAANIHAGKVIPQLEGLDFTVVAVSPNNIDEVMQAMELVGKVSNVNATTGPLVKALRDRIDIVVNKTATLSQSQLTKTFYIVWHDPLQTIGATSFIHSLIGAAGGLNISGDIEEKYPKVSLETVIGYNPQAIIAQIGMGSGEDGPLIYAQTEPLLAGVDARSNGQIYGVISDVVGRPGPRVVDALEQLAKMLHPELFS